MADNKLYDILGVSRNATDSEIKKVILNIYHELEIQNQLNHYKFSINSSLKSVRFVLKKRVVLLDNVFSYEVSTISRKCASFTCILNLSMTVLYQASKP